MLKKLLRIVFSISICTLTLSVSYGPYKQDFELAVYLHLTVTYLYRSGTRCNVKTITNHIDIVEMYKNINKLVKESKLNCNYKH